MNSTVRIVHWPAYNRTTFLFHRVENGKFVPLFTPEDLSVY